MTDKPELIETPYDDDVRELAHDFGLSLNHARDRFIWVGLQMRDVGPLICFLLMGYVPGLTLRQNLALMMEPEEALAQTSIRKELLRFRFEIKSRTGKRGPKRSNLEVGLRDRRIAKRVRNLMAKIGSGSYEAAIRQIADETNLGVQTVRDAYDERGKKTTN
jgi:hypothetical protein